MTSRCRQLTRGGSSDWGLSGGLTNSYRKQINVLRNIKQGFGPLRNLEFYKIRCNS
jgi:hypothetical protein